ncbi:MAG: Gmad2 immunoglobulin-like domain-containing protein [Planctomycetes bacterium]|nr:Gmad2 immunoglobulin-like domain-containing protein [Planctomycetota bacterium]
MGMRTMSALTALVALAAAEEGNLLPNGDLEKGTEGWVFFQLGGADGREVEKGALHVTKAADSPERPAMIWTDYALGGAGEGTLAFSIRAKGRKLGRAQILFILWDDAGNPFAEEKVLDGDLGAKWKTFEATIAIPGPAKGGRILVKLFGKGELWLDDASVTIAGAPPAERGKTGKLGLRNGDFDTSKDGWAAFPGSDGLRVALDGKELRLSRGGHRLYPELGVQQVVKLPGKARKVALKCKARAEGATAIVALVAETEEGALVACARAEPKGEIALPLDVPPGAKRLRVVLAIRGPGDAWFDDVVLE